MLRVKLQTVADRGQFELKDEGMMIKDYLAEKNANMASSFSLDGRPLSVDELSKTFADFQTAGIIRGEDVIVYETAKTNGA